MRLILVFITILTVAACSIQDAHPDYEYPEGSDASGTDWPELAITAELEQAGVAVAQKTRENQIETDQLAARARALRARAERLRRQSGK